MEVQLLSFYTLALNESECLYFWPIRFTPDPRSSLYPRTRPDTRVKRIMSYACRVSKPDHLALCQYTLLTGQPKTVFTHASFIATILFLAVTDINQTTVFHLTSFVTLESTYWAIRLANHVRFMDYLQLPFPWETKTVDCKWLFQSALRTWDNAVLWKTSSYYATQVGNFVLSCVWSSKCTVRVFF